MNNDKKKLTSLFFLLGLLFLMVAEFILHRKVIFMMDDNWYSTNLATGAFLSSFKDILESQVWHFLNWGGRVITHGILQMTLMGGELFCDILNVLMTLLLAWIICVIARSKNLFSFFAASTLLISLNANFKMSMFWQSGTANYVYATTWILVFLWAYLRPIQETDAPVLPLIQLWIPVLGLITGWSNENMGPASFILTLIVMIYLSKVQKKKIPLWMISGSFFCLLGSALVILAPGNFVRVSHIPEEGLLQTLYNRLLSMLCAGTDFLFATALLLTTLILIYTIVLKERLQPAHWMLLIHAILSYGAMVLSPHYPDRATFGTMAVCIILFVFILSGIIDKYTIWKKYIYTFLGILWIYSLYTLLSEIYLFMPD